jgi:hypothetical protein
MNIYLSTPHYRHLGHDATRRGIAHGRFDQSGLEIRRAAGVSGWRVATANADPFRALSQFSTTRSWIGKK